MTEKGRILIADDDETFLRSTADLLRREGYYCDCAPDSETAIKILGAAEYDLLIADIKMPGNVELDLIRVLPEIAKGMPVILVTGYPSVSTAIESIRLPVITYMVKPLDFDKLLESVESSVLYAATYRTVSTTRRQLESRCEDLANVEQLMRLPSSDAAGISISTFVDVTLGNIVVALSDLKNLTEALAAQQHEHAACHLFNCPRPATLIEGLEEAVSTLKKTKSAFKSKELGELRRKLEDLIDAEAVNKNNGI